METVDRCQYWSVDTLKADQSPERNESDLNLHFLRRMTFPNRHRSLHCRTARNDQALLITANCCCNFIRVGL